MRAARRTKASSLLAFLSLSIDCDTEGFDVQNVDYTIKSGQRLAQICSPDLKPITWCFMDELSQTARGEGGFGSTGQ